MDGLLLDALYAKYHAEKADAVARFNIYLNKFSWNWRTPTTYRRN